MGEVPPTLYIALGLQLVGTLTFLVANLANGASEFSMEIFEATYRWRLLEQACWAASSILLPLGFLELAKRCSGPPRALGIVAASLMFASVSWVPFQILVAWIQPQSPDIFDWFGRLTGITSLATILLMTFAADAWRRVLPAAIVLLLLVCTSGWVPVIGHAIGDLLHSWQVRTVYGSVRTVVYVGCYALIAGALAARGHLAPDRRRGASGFRIARGALLFRLYAAAALVLAVLVAIHSPEAGTLFVVGAPLVAVVTMLVFSIGLVRAAASNVDGIPRVRLALGAATSLWWLAIQVDQLMELYDSSRGHDRTIDHTTVFSIAGPIIATIGLGVVASGIAAFATRRGDATLASSLTARAAAFVVLSLVGIGVQSLGSVSMSAATAVTLVVLSIGLGIASLVVLAGVLRDAARLVERVPVPAARIV